MTDLDPVEKAIVGPFILGDSDCVSGFEDITQLGFKDSHFNSLSMRTAWRRIGDMINEGAYTPERLLSFLNESEAIGANLQERALWVYHVSKCGTIQHLRIHAMDVMEKHLRQEADIAMSHLQNKKGSGTEVLNDLELKLSELRGKGALVRKDEKLEACEDLKQEIEAMMNGSSLVRSSYVPIWDKCIGGLPDAKLIIISARPGQGKTSISEQLVDNSARAGIPVLYIQRELSHTNAIGRLACRKASVPWWKVEKRKCSTEESNRLLYEIEKYKTLPLYLNCNGIINGSTIGPIIRYHAKQYGIRLVVLDYITLIDIPKGVERWVAIGELTRAMKRAANDTGCTCIGLAQLGRDQEKRKKEHSKPTLSDLRESGNIEQDADIVLGLWVKEESEDSQYPVMWTVLKNRNGAKGTTEVLFDGPKMEFLGEIKR